MTQGLFTSAGGIKAHQAKMDVIADNIANLNTTGFKSSMMNFETIFSKTSTTGTAPSSNFGGTNPKQVGLGVQISEIGRDFSQGNIQTTGRAGDLSIEGEGFFVLENGSAGNTASSGILLTRAGSFQLDANGVLADPHGLRVLGMSDLQSASISTNNYIKLPRSLNLEKTTVGTTVTNVVINDTGVAGTNPIYDCALSTFSVGTDGGIEATYSNGDRISVRTDATGLTREMTHYPSEGGGPMTVGTGNLTINNGMQASQLQLMFATVTNNGGLKSLGGNLYEKAANSGEPFFSIGRNAGVGRINSGGLETSNVDLTKEFSLLMLSQRGLEANSRCFDSHNKVLQTIVNLAR